MKVAITDHSFANLEIEELQLQAQGHEIVAWKEKRPAAELPALVADADAVITQFAPLTAEVIASMRQARIIVRYGIGVDNVDLEAAREKGIPVCNVPDYCIEEVADHTLALLLALTRQVVINCENVRQGGWGLAGGLNQMRTLRDLTVGVVGFGRIGREVARRLQAFKCRILVHDPLVYSVEVEQRGCVPTSLDQLLADSDAITLHCPSTARTRGLLNRDSLARAKTGVLVVNVARGDLINSAALLEALGSGKVAAAALDVFDPEPIPPDHPILRLSNVIVSPHVASASVPAVRKLRETAARLVIKALRGDPLPNVVNGVAVV